MSRIPEVEAALRPDLRGRTAYGAPQLDVAVQLNTNESSYPVPGEVIADALDRLRTDLEGLNRYPDREFSSLRAALADYLAMQSGVRLSPAQLWAGNGSNEVLQHLVQAFGGPRADRHRLHARLLDAPDHRRDPRHPLGRRPA